MMAALPGHDGPAVQTIREVRSVGVSVAISHLRRTIVAAHVLGLCRLHAAPQWLSLSPGCVPLVGNVKNDGPELPTPA
jgi:hypothetical protein